MQHLDIDRLAALADEPATPTESEHLASCVVCRREFEAYGALLALARRDGQAGQDPDLPAPLPITSWDTLGAALRREGLVKTPRPATGPGVAAEPAAAFHVTRSSAGWRRAAASVALLVGGAALGRLSAAPTTPEPIRLPDVLATASSTPAAPSAPSPATPGADTAAPRAGVSAGLSDTIPVAGEPRATFASAGNGDGPLTFASTRQALQVLTRAQRDYQSAAAYLAEHDTTTTVGNPQMLRARLAALDEVMPKVREALYEAPQDPMLNQYYLTTYEARESTLRQLARALPVGMRLNGF